VMAAIQALRKDAQKAGNLKNTPQQTVTTEGQTIVIEPANPEVVYVPTYSPAVVYGTPIAAYPGYSGWDVAAASAISFGVGAAVGAAFNYGWGGAAGEPTGMEVQPPSTATIMFHAATRL